MANNDPAAYQSGQYSTAPVGTYGDPNARPDTMGPNTGTNAFTGFAARYPAAGAENIWQNPWMMLPDVFQGINQQGAGYQALRNLNADPMALYEMIAGKNNALAGGDSGTGTSDYINWLASLYQSLGTAGGRGFSAKELLQNLFNPGSTTGSSSLQNVLAGGDANTQMRTLFNMAKDASNVGMNPLAARGYQAALANAGDRAINMASKANVGEGASNIPIYQLIKQIAPGLIPG